MPAMNAALTGNSSATIRKMIAAAKASQNICMNWTVVFDSPNTEKISAIKIE